MMPRIHLYSPNQTTISSVRRDFILRASTVVFVLAFSLDYRSVNSGGDVSQLIMLALSLISFATIVILLPLPRLRPRQWIVPALFFLIAQSAITATAFGVPFDVLYRLELRYILLLMAAIVGERWLSTGRSLSFLLGLIGIAACISVCFNIYYTLTFRGLSIDRARYYIAPTSALVAFGLTLLLATRGRVLYVAGLAVFAFAIFLSATRTYAIGLMAACAALVIFAIRQHDQRVLVTIALALLVIAVTVGAGMVGGFELWQARFSYGPNIEDPTWSSRLAEYVSQLRMVSENELYLLVGRGFGTEYVWDIDLMRSTYELGYGKYEGGEVGSGFGHSVWVNNLFNHGILAGWVIPTIHLSALLDALKSAWSKILPRETRDTRVMIALALVAYFPATFFSNPFGDRLFCVVIGILFVAPAIAYRSVSSARFVDASRRDQRRVGVL